PDVVEDDFVKILLVGEVRRDGVNYVLLEGLPRPLRYGVVHGAPHHAVGGNECRTQPYLSHRRSSGHLHGTGVLQRGSNQSVSSLWHKSLVRDVCPSYRRE